MNDLEDRQKTCGIRCIYYGRNPDIPESPCYLCRRNIKDNRTDWFENIKENKNE